MDRDDVGFPDTNEIAPYAIAFARMMFAHAEFERGIRSLVDAINPKEPGFGERHANQWTASESGTEKIIDLIIKSGNGLPEIEQISREQGNYAACTNQRLHSEDMVVFQPPDLNR